jgi:hypothetical protein
LQGEFSLKEKNNRKYKKIYREEVFIDKYFEELEQKVRIDKSK